MKPTDIVSALQEGQKLTVVTTDNHGFQIIRRLQLFRAGDSFETEFRACSTSGRLDGGYLPLDLVGAAEGLGARGWHCTDEALLRAARERAGVSVVVVVVEKQSFMPSSETWWDHPPPEVSDDPETSGGASSTRPAATSSGTSSNRPDLPRRAALQTTISRSRLASCARRIGLGPSFARGHRDVATTQLEHPLRHSFR